MLGKSKALSFDSIAFFLLLYVFLPAFVLSIFLLLRAGSPALAYQVALGILGWQIFRCREETTSRDVLCFFLIVLFCHGVSYLLFDTFHDGLAYHQPAISCIAEGFNPVYDGYMNLGRLPDLWSDQATYFPKLTWYFAASVAAAFGDIQMGKAYTLILLFSSIFFVFHHTRGEASLKRCLWVLACLNPIALTEFTGYVVDGALGSLAAIALFYADFYFSGRPLSRIPRIMGTLSLAMLFCVKTSGFAYGAIILFCVFLHAFYMEVRTFAGFGSVRWADVFKKSMRPMLNVGIPVLLLVVVMGFAPYATNLLQKKHIFHPLMQSDASDTAYVPSTLEKLAGEIYPDAGNRLTRLFFSVAAYPTFVKGYPAELKNPLGAPWLEWQRYTAVGPARAGGLGPLFFLLLLVSVLYWCLPGGRGNLWLLFTLCLMILAQPHAWQVRYVPFLWMLPFFLCLALPDGKAYLLVLPVLLALWNTVGVAYFFIEAYWQGNQRIVEALAPYRGEYVLLDKSMFQCDGFFDRFDIRQKFANPEETAFRGDIPWSQYRPQRYTGRPAFGSNIAFNEDIPGLPTRAVPFSEEIAGPWVTMSDGIILYDPTAPQFGILPPSSTPKGCWNYTGKIKFFMQVREKPVGDRVFAFTAAPRTDDKENVLKQSMKVFVNNRQLGEWLFDRPGSTEKTIVIPRAMLEESYNDEMHLLMLTFYLSGSDPNETQAETQMFSLMFEKMEFRPVTQ